MRIDFRCYEAIMELKFQAKTALFFGTVFFIFLGWRKNTLSFSSIALVKL